MKLLSRRPLSCQELVELLTDYLEQALAPRRRRAVEAHLSGCENCQAYMAQMKLTIELTGRLAVEDVEPAALEELMELFRDWRR